MAPVAEPGTMPMRGVSGSWSISRIRTMQYWRRVLPILARFERPSDSVASFSGDQTGGLAQGPEEKSGRVGRTCVVVSSLILFSPCRELALRWDRFARERPSVVEGKGWS